jgi:hypothetical protein
MKSVAILLAMFALAPFLWAQNIPATLEEYDALPHDQQIKIYRNLPKEMRDKIVAREQAELKERQKVIEGEKKKRLAETLGGFFPMSEVLLFEKKMKTLAAQKEYPDPADERLIKRLKEIEEQYQSKMQKLTNAASAPKVELWNKYKDRFDDLQKRYPLEGPSSEAVEVIEREVKLLLADVEKLPRNPEK